MTSQGDDEPRACEAPKEDPEAARIRAEREAEARREAWSRGEGERGMTSRHGASQVAPPPAVCTGPTIQERAAAETAKKDLPLEHDFIGNMIPGLIVGGLMSGLEAAAAGLGLRGIAGHVAAHGVVDVEADVIAHEGAHAAEAIAGPPKPPAPAPAPPPAFAPRSEPPPVGRDRVPYAPGHAPVVIPEAPVIMLRG